MNTVKHISPMARADRRESLARAAGSIAWLALLSILSIPLILGALAASLRTAH